MNKNEEYYQTLLDRRDNEKSDLDNLVDILKDDYPKVMISRNQLFNTVKSKVKAYHIPTLNKIKKIYSKRHGNEEYSDEQYEKVKDEIETLVLIETMINVILKSKKYPRCLA